MIRTLKRWLWIVAALLMIAAGPARAQFYRAYEWETPMQGWVEGSLWDTFVAKSNNRYQHLGKDVSQEGLWAHSLEVEYGMTDRFALGAYADVEDPREGSAQYTRARIVGRYRFFNRYERVFNPAIYFEYYFPRQSYDDTEELETRLILEHDFEDVRLLLNPTLSKGTSGTGVNRGTELQLAAGVYYRRYFPFQPGLELFSKFGPISNFDSRDEQQHILFLTANIRPASGWRWQLGVGGGLTQAADDWTVKSILSYEFQTVRPSRWAH